MDKNQLEENVKMAAVHLDENVGDWVDIVDDYELDMGVTHVIDNVGCLFAIGQDRINKFEDHKFYDSLNGIYSATGLRTFIAEEDVFAVHHVSDEEFCKILTELWEEEIKKRKN